MSRVCGERIDGMERRKPPHPWSDLPCRADDLFDVVGAFLRGDDVTSVATAYPTAALDVLIDRHRLGPLLATRCLAAPAAASLPEATLARLRATHQRQQSIARRCLVLLDEIEAQCRSARLRFLVVKGMAMAQRWYGDVAARGYWDLDLMVAEADRACMEAILRGLGAFRLSRVVVAPRWSAAFHHAFDYERDGVKLDLHWCMTRLPGMAGDVDEAFARCERLDLQGRTITVLSLQDELHFLLVSAFADILRGHLRLQTFVDLWELSRRVPEDAWSAFFEQRRREGSEAVCCATLGVLLAALRLGDMAPALVRVIDAYPTAESARALLLPSPGGWRSKSWGASLVPGGRVRNAVWWATSLPFRLAASHPAWRRRRPAGRVESGRQ